MLTVDEMATFLGISPQWVQIWYRHGLLGIPTKKIAHSELMTIKPSPSDAVRDILE